jgi:hypothetical protein
MTGIRTILTSLGSGVTVRLGRFEGLRRTAELLEADNLDVAGAALPVERRKGAPLF